MGLVDEAALSSYQMQLPLIPPISLLIKEN
jgi:hypothetical protein